MDVKKHWNKVWKERAPEDVSWYQPTPETSLALIRGALAGPRGRVLDVGGGASSLVDHLLDEGFERPGVLDVSATALAVARERLGERAEDVDWIEGDVTGFHGGSGWDLWHDRAVLHFLVDEEGRIGYRESLLSSLKPGGSAVIATFGPDGPTRCSGLEVRRHSAEEIEALLAPELRLRESRDEDHPTPGGQVQRFVFAVLERPA